MVSLQKHPKVSKNTRKVSKNTRKVSKNTRTFFGMSKKVKKSCAAVYIFVKNDPLHNGVNRKNPTFSKNFSSKSENWTFLKCPKIIFPKKFQ